MISLKLLYKGDARIHVSMVTAYSPVLFLIILFALVYFIPKWIQRTKDNKEQLIKTTATVLSKRIHATSKYIVSYAYYVTFEVANQRKVELRVPAKRYGSFVEGNHGNLQFQGTRFIEWML
jgi:hypothetical protein